MDLLACRWCHAQNPAGTASCATCGAPLDAADVVSESGWREAPRLKDMTEFHFGHSTAQIEGDLVPVIDVALGGSDAADTVYFEHHVLLWKDEQTTLSAHGTGGLKRSLGGMPFVLSQAAGPGRIAFSRDAAGELVVLPMHQGMEIDVREHAFLIASGSVNYSFVRIKGLANVLHGGDGMFLDRFVTEAAPGLLVLHGNGNVFERTLQPGEKILVEPGAYLYKDASVQMNTVQQDVRTGLFKHGLYLAEMVGPGRVGIQSLYVHHHSE